MAGMRQIHPNNNRGKFGLGAIHQLRHAHATELVNDGVSLATIRKRLGHKHIQTTLRYAQLSDETADAEIRAWRRKKQ
jgi:site-specific recombinase XerD